MSKDPRSAMEGRARRRASPSGMRTKSVRVEPEPPTPTRRHEPGTRVAVVYYLCRNHQLEHPHFMEVTLASPQGLYLRDVIGRLDALRGKGMATKYSWSCKRSYKTGFVWHDLSADDLLLPTQGTEYVLKGSELPFDHSKPLPMPDHQQNNAVCANNAKVQPCKPARQQESPPSPGSSNQGWTSKSPSPTPTTYPAVPVIKEEVPPPPPSPPPPTARAAVVPAMKEVAVPPPLPQPVSPSSPSASTTGDEEQCRIPPHSGSSSNSSPKTSMASSDTSSPSPPKPAAAGSDAATQTDDKARWDDVKLQHRQGTARASSSSPEGPEIVADEESRCTRAPAGEDQPRSRRSGTLQSLIRAEAAGRRRCLPLPVEDDRAAAATGGSVSGRLKPANLLMRLMACGPSHPGSFGLVQTSSYKPCFPQLEYTLSPELSPLGALKPAENCSGRLLDGPLNRSSSSSRSHQEGVVCEEEEAWPKGFNNNLSRSASKRTSDPSSGRTASSSKAVSFRDE